MNNALRSVLGTLAVLVVIAGGFLFMRSADATETREIDCHNPTMVVTTQPFVPGTPGTPGVPAVAEVWANFSPDHQQGPFTGPPAYPTDPRGTWHTHDNIPGGHEGPDGVYQRDNPGNGRADWFYRQNGVAEVPEVPAVPEILEVTEEVPNPNYPCETNTPTVTPNPDRPVRSTQCVGNDLVVTIEYVNGNIEHYSHPNHRLCRTGSIPEDPEKPGTPHSVAPPRRADAPDVPVIEEGM